MKKVILLFSMLVIACTTTQAQLLLEFNNAVSPNREDAKKTLEIDQRAKMQFQSTYSKLKLIKISPELDSIFLISNTHDYEKNIASLQSDMQSLKNQIEKFQKVQQNDAQRAKDDLVKLSTELFNVIRTKDSLLQLVNSKLALQSALFRAKENIEQLTEKDSIANSLLEKNTLRILSNRIYYANYEQQIDTTQLLISNKKAYIDTLNDVTIRLDILKNKRDVAASIASELKKELKTMIAEFGKQHVDTNKIQQLPLLAKEYDLLQNTLEQQEKTIDAINLKWKSAIDTLVQKKPAPKKANDISILPYVNSITGLKDINANLNLIGNAVPNNVNGLYTEYGVYTRILTGADSASAYKMLMSDISNFGVYLKTSIGLIPEAAPTFKKRIAANLALFYLNKPLLTDTTKGIKDNFNASVFHFKFGVEVLVFKDIFSAYINANNVTIVTNNDKVKTLFDLTKNDFSFIDFGVRMLLNPTNNEQSNFKIYFDMNFISNTGAAKNFDKTNSSTLIPNFKIGVRTKLGHL